MATIAGAAGILMIAGKILFVFEEENDKRTHKKAGQMSLPAGWIQEDEDLVGTVEREFLEETGLRVQVTEYFKDSLIPDTDLLVAVYIVELAQGGIRPGQGELKTEWLPLRNIIQQDADGHFARKVLINGVLDRLEREPHMLRPGMAEILNEFEKHQAKVQPSTVLIHMAT